MAIRRVLGIRETGKDPPDAETHKNEQKMRIKNIFQAICATFMLGPSLLDAQAIIGGTTPDPSAVLEIQSNNRGLLLSRMTTDQRNAIVSPAAGLLIFNTTTLCLEINQGTSASPFWEQVSCRDGGEISTLDCAGATVSGSSVIIPYTGGNGGAYSRHVINSTGFTGFTATLPAGNFATGAGSLSLDISGTPSGSGAATFALSFGGQTCNFTTYSGCGAFVAPGDWKVFSCYNLGAASTSADPFTPGWEINGGYWQWGRLTEAAPGPTGSGSGQANDAFNGVWNTTNADNGSWADGSKTANDPCPSGFRVPTAAQWDGVLANNTVTNAGTNWVAGATNYDTGKKFGDNLMLPAAGTRRSNDGALAGRGSFGYYWSSTESGTNKAWSLILIIDDANKFNFNRTGGQSVRCIAE